MVGQQEGREDQIGERDHATVFGAALRLLLTHSCGMQCSTLLHARSGPSLSYPKLAAGPWEFADKDVISFSVH
jgi:hypothetical protein